MMLSFRKILLFLFLILNLALANDNPQPEGEEIKVYRDTSAPNYIGEKDSIFLWSAVATFKRELTDGQLVAVAEDGYKSMLENIKNSNDVDLRRIPLVMVAMMHQAPDRQWTVYLASSAKGTASLIYKVREAIDKKGECGEFWDTVPEDLKEALRECSKETGYSYHKNGGSCGEMNVLLEVAAGREDPKRIASESTIVAWEGSQRKGVYKKGKVKAPCSDEGKYGCKDTLQALTDGIRVIEPKDDQDKGPTPEPYTGNMPVSVKYQPLWPGLETPQTAET
ncbi:hypothetical protein BDV18DRAFT_106611 [Aspergillus unguis]